MTKVIPREAKRITYSSEIRALKNKQFSAEQLSIINGSLLGDGGLQSGWTGTSKNYRFATMHSIRQKEYIDWMYEKLKPFVLSPPWLYEPTQSLRVRTISHPDLTDVRSRFYNNRKKILPNNIEEIISNELSLAVWFMDDGNVISRKGKVVGYNLNTQSFSLKENEMLINLFKEVYSICPVIEKNKGKYRLGIWNKKSREVFHSTIQYYILPSMKYKLG